MADSVATSFSQSIWPGASANPTAPVKTTSDLLVLRSDAYQLTEDQEVRLAGNRTVAPLVDLHSAYRLVGDFDGFFPYGAPSLINCDRLTVQGPWTFGRDVVVRGTVTVPADGAPGVIPDGTILRG